MAGTTSFRDLTMEQIKKAFEKTRQNFETMKQSDTTGNLDHVKLVHITEEYYATACKFAQEHFMTQEPLNKALGMQWTLELEKFWMNSFKLNLSLMFIDEKNGEPMAFRTTRIARPDDNSKIDLDSIQSEPLKELLRFIIYGDEKADFFGHFGCTEAFHFLGLGVADKYKQRRLATHIFNTAIDMILNFEIDPVCVKVEGSSNFSKSIFENAGFETLFELPFATWEVDGKFPIQNTGIHKSMKVYGKKFTKN